MMKLFTFPFDPNKPADGFSLKTDNSYYQEHLVINRFFEQLNISVIGLDEERIKSFVNEQSILRKEPADQIRMAHALMERIVFRHSDDGFALGKWILREDPNRAWRLESAISKLLDQIIKRKPNFSEIELTWYIIELNSLPRLPFHYFPYRSLVGRIETILHKPGNHMNLIEQLRILYRRMSPVLGVPYSRIRFILEGRQKKEIEPGEPWSNKMRMDLLQMNPEQRNLWDALLQQIIHSDGSKPTKDWLKQANESIKLIGEDKFFEITQVWLEMALKKTSVVIPPHSSDLLKGLVWCCILIPGTDVSYLLGNLALACYQKIPNFGARSVKVGNACIYALSISGVKEAVSELVRLQQKVKRTEVQRLVHDAIDHIAAKQKITVTDLEEMSIPTFNLDLDGCYTQAVGDYSAEIRIISSRTAQLTWKSTDGKVRESVPAAIKQDHKTEISALRKSVKSIESTLSAQCSRIEHLLLLQPVWDYEIWYERYLNHPLLSQIVRRLIWQFSNEDRKILGIWQDGQIVGVDQGGFDWLTPATKVRLWHPLGFEIDTVFEWRKYLEEHQITQPFKQAHREIYLLTDAELNTVTYSNRFAAHILKQHQFVALCKQREWKYSLQGDWDSFNTPTLNLPAMSLQVKLFVEPISDGDIRTGIFPYVTTDQVCFLNDKGDRFPLSEIPAILFSEIMRDIDLFVGVCSVGNDPSWADRGENVIGRDYWQHYAFGNL